MADWSRGTLARQATNAAAPSGLQQTAAGAASGLNPWGAGSEAPEDFSYGDVAQQWYGGQNLQGIDNGWDTTFMQNAYAMQGAYLEKSMLTDKYGNRRANKYYDWVDDDKATGVVTWNDEGKGLKAGDIFNGGEKVGNLYKDFDQYTADVMLGEYMGLDRNEKARMFNDPDRENVYRERISTRIDEETQRRADVASVTGFESDVSKRQEEMLHGLGDEAIAVGSGVMAGGMAAGATAAAVAAGATSWTGIGTIPAAGVAFIGGFIWGGISAYLNKDQTTEVAARAAETVQRAQERYQGDWIAHSAVALDEWSGVAMSMLNPMRNTVQGAYDWAAEGRSIGDGRAEFYEVDEEGNRKAPKWVRGLDLAATVADSMLQFGSVFGTTAYLTAMAGSSIGGAMVPLTTDAVFNPRTGRFDQLEGADEYLSAIGNVTIEFAQLGLAGATAGMSRRMGTLASTAEAGGMQAVANNNWLLKGLVKQEEVVGKGLAKMDKAFDRGWARLQRNRTAQGDDIVFRSEGGLRYGIRPAGEGTRLADEVVSIRPTMQMLAPSEFAKAVSTYGNARIHKGLGEAITYDDVYRSALNLSSANSTFGSAFLNAYSEALEEGVQSVLEPLQTSSAVHMSDVVEAMMYGAASGAGMGLGAFAATPHRSARVDARARRNFMVMNNQPEMTDAEWEMISKAMSPAQVRALAKLDPEQIDRTRSIGHAIEALHRTDGREGGTGSLFGAAASSSKMLWDAWTRGLANVNPKTGDTLVVMGSEAHWTKMPNGVIEEAHPPNVAALSAWELVHQLKRINEGVKLQLSDAEARVTAAEQKVKETKDPDRLVVANDELAAVQAELADISEAVKHSDMMVAIFSSSYQKFAQETDETKLQDHIDEMNRRLMRAVNGEWLGRDRKLLPPDQQEFVRRAVELRINRQPNINTGSFGVFIPQISAAMTRMNAHSTVYLHQSAIKAPGADHDGDTVQTMNHVYLPPDELRRMRRGAAYVQTKTNEEGKEVLEIVADAPDGEAWIVKQFSLACDDVKSGEAIAVHAGLARLRQAMIDRYATQTVPKAMIDTLFKQFAKEVLAGNPDARKNFVNGMLNASPEMLYTMADSTRTPEVLWMMWRISSEWEQITNELMHRHYVAYSAPADSPSRNPELRTNMKNKAIRDAANAAADIAIHLGSDPVRTSQKLHYSFYRSAVDTAGREGKGYIPEKVRELIAMYALLGSGVDVSAEQQFISRTGVEDRVFMWLQAMLKEARQEGLYKGDDALLMLAMSAAPDIDINSETDYSMKDRNITVLQLLLRKSLQIEKARASRLPPEDPIHAKLARLTELAYPRGSGQGHSETASLALVELFGSRQLHELVGRDSMYLGPQATLHQLVGQLVGRHPRVRTQMKADWRRAPAYLSHRKRGNPPYDVATLTAKDPVINGFTLLLDAVSATADTNIRRLETRSNKDHEIFIKGFSGFKQQLDRWRDIRSKDLDLTGLSTEDARRAVLQDFLRYNPRVARSTIEGLFPTANDVGAFELQGDQLFTAKWLEEVMIQENPERAAVIYHVHSNLSILNLLGARVPREGEKVKDGEHPVQGIRAAKIQSRFQQTIYILAQRPDKMELNRFLETCYTAESLENLYGRINSEPDWLNNREKLLPWQDDVALFEQEPGDGWTQTLPSVQRRQALQAWAKEMEAFNGLGAEAKAIHSSNERLVQSMRAALRGEDDGEGGVHYIKQLKKAIRIGRVFPDSVGSNSRDEWLKFLAIPGAFRTHDKGTADERAAAMGEVYAMADGYGVRMGLSKEIDAQTMYDAKDILANPSLLLDGPVRVQVTDALGRGGNLRLEIDENDLEPVLDMFSSTITQGLAMAAIFQSTRDTDLNGNLQQYMLDGNVGNLRAMLDDVDHDWIGHSTFSYEEAHRYIGMVEAAMRKDARFNGDEKAQDDAFLSLTKYIGDFIVASQTSTQTDVERQAVREKIVINFATRLRDMAALEPSQHKKVRARLETELVDRYQGSNDALMRARTFITSDVEKENVTEDWRQENIELINQRLEVINKTVKSGTTTKEEDDSLLEETKKLQQLQHDIAQGKEPPPREMKSLAEALSSFELSFLPDTNSVSLDNVKKTLIIEFLFDNNRVNRFAGKQYELVDYVKENVGRDPQAMARLEDEDWRTLSEWATSVMFAEFGGRTASFVKMLPIILGPKGDQIRRYMDMSHGYLLDPFFDPAVMKAARILNHVGQQPPPKDRDDIADDFLRTLLSPQALGEWNELIPVLGMRQRQVLKNAVVGMALPSAGITPISDFDATGSAWATYRRPPMDDTALTTVTIDGVRGESLADMIGKTDPRLALKLEHHFVRQIVVKSSKSKKSYNLMKDGAHTGIFHSEVEKAALEDGLKILSLQDLDEAVRALVDRKKWPDVSIEIEYVDVDKKPFNPQFANNVFFEGVGRESLFGGTGGAIADLLFSQDGLSKIGQQQPLDQLTKDGSPYRETITTSTTWVESVEGNMVEPDVAEVLSAKAVRAHSVDYGDTGKLLAGDLNALYKLFKMRHLVVGFDSATGKKVVLWSEDVIHRQKTGKDIGLEPGWRLVPISGDTLRTLLGHGSRMGTGLATQMPVLNPQDLDKFPDLSQERLNSLGLGNLGDTLLLQNTSLAQMTAPPRHMMRNKKLGKKYAGERPEAVLDSERVKILEERGDRRRSGEGRFDMTQIRKDNIVALNHMLAVEQLAPMLNVLGVPATNAPDLSWVRVARELSAELNRSMENSNQMVWHHIQDATTDLSRGLLGQDSTSTNFKGIRAVQPCKGDFVVIDLSSIIRATKQANGDLRAAEAMAHETIRAYARRGVNIVLASSEGDQAFRNMLVSWIREGAIGYRPLAGSRHFFVPLKADEGDSANKLALDSTQTTVQVMQDDGLELRFVSDAFLQSNENAEHRDLRHNSTWRRYANVPIPTAVSSSMRRFIFNVPISGLGAADQRTRFKEMLLPLLSTDEGMKYLMDMAGKDPHGIPYYKENDNGTITPGILGIRQALERLRDDLIADRWPWDQGYILHHGAIIPMMSADNIPMLGRVGFEMPSSAKILEQSKKHYQQGDRRVTVCVASNEMVEDLTIRPPFEVQQVDPQPGGLMITGKYTLQAMGKMITGGFKGTYTPWPEHLLPPDEPLSPNGTRIVAGISRKAVEGKHADEGMVKDLRWLFAAAGVDFRDDILDFFVGKYPGGGLRPKAQLDADWADLSILIKDWARENSGLTVEEIAEILDKQNPSPGPLASFLSDFSKKYPGLPTPSFDVLTAAQQGGGDPQAWIVYSFMMSLLAPGVEIDHLIGTHGLLSLPERDTRNQIILMPPLFTDALTHAGFLGVRELLVNRVNTRLPKGPDGKPLYFFDKHLNFYMRVETDRELATTSKEVRKTSTKKGLVKDQTYEEREGLVVDPNDPYYGYIKGKLQVTLPVMADENAASYAAAALRQKSEVSPHIASVVAGAIGGRTVLQTPVKLENIFGENRIMRFKEGSGESLYDMLTRVDPNDPDAQAWERLTPMMVASMEEGSRLVGQYTQAIPKKKWTSSEREQVIEKSLVFLGELGFRDDPMNELPEVDYLVRQFLGRPAPAKDQKDYKDIISPTLYIEVVQVMLNNIKGKNTKGFPMQPLHGGKVPMPHMVFWRKVFDAQKDGDPVWAPGMKEVRQWWEKDKDGRMFQRGSTQLAETWDQWCVTLVGQMLSSNKPFHSMHRKGLNGMWQTYLGQPAVPTASGLELETLANMMMYDPELERNLRSADMTQNALLNDAVTLDQVQKSLDNLLGHSKTYEPGVVTHLDASELGQQFDAQKEWLTKNKMPKQADESLQDYMKKGAYYLASANQTNNYFRTLTNLSVFMRLANPQLYVSAMIEVPVRNLIENFTNIVMGNQIGAWGKTLSKFNEMIGGEPKFTADQISQLRAIAKSIGTSNEFLGQMYDELVYKNHVEAGKGWLGTRIEFIARTVARATSDPRFGMTQTMLGLRYLEAVWEYLESSDAVITVDQFIAEMKADPMWLAKQTSAKQGLTAHKAGMNRIAQVQSRKQTVMARSITRRYDSLCMSDKLYKNLAGHALKIPFLFTRFNVNAFVTLTGLEGVDQMIAMHMHGRRTFGSMVRKAIPGMENKETVNDMSDIIESLDLVRPLVRGAMTQTGWMALGLMGFQLGIGGDDDEAKKRKRIAEYLNLPFYRDPREAASDFLYSEAIFFDDIPFLKNIFRDPESGVSAVVPHWILRQFTSPMMGIERFFATGDVRQIGWGFWDAISVMPYSVLNIWNEADMTARLLAESADAINPEESEAARSAQASLLMTIVATYEKALLESSFINAVRNSFDEYNRNPWMMPKLDKNGDIVKDKFGNPVPTDQLVAFVDDEGKRRTGFARRDEGEALRHLYAENNATWALLASIFDGQFNLMDSTYMRQNMVVSQKEINLPETDESKFKAFVMKTFIDSGGQQTLTLDETIRKIQQRYRDANIWYNQSEVEAEALQIVNSSSTKEGAMTLLDKEGKEWLSSEGFKSYIRSINGGLLTVDEASRMGINASQELRDKVAKEMWDGLVQEGVDLGLGIQASEYRAKRLWYGDTENPEDPGLRAIIYSKKIPKEGSVKYNQLQSTFLIGPDGKPWATPFKRMTFAQAMGIPLPHMTHATDDSMTKDKTKGTLIDEVLGINLGLHGLERVGEANDIKAKDDFITKTDSKKASSSSGRKYTPWKRSGWRNFGRRSGGGGGGGGGYVPPFQRMYALPGGYAPRMDDIPLINVNIPYIREAQVNRERITSERGRLKQWQ